MQAPKLLRSQGLYHYLFRYFLLFFALASIAEITQAQSPSTSPTKTCLRVTEDFGGRFPYPIPVLSFYCTCTKGGYIVFGENNDVQQCLLKCGQQNRTQTCGGEKTQEIAQSCCKECGGGDLIRRPYFLRNGRPWYGLGCFTSSPLPSVPSSVTPSPSATPSSSPTATPSKTSAPPGSCLQVTKGNQGSNQKPIPFLSFYCTCSRGGRIVASDDSNIEKCLMDCGNQQKVPSCGGQKTVDIITTCCQNCGGGPLKSGVHTLKNGKVVGLGCFASPSPSPSISPPSSCLRVTEESKYPLKVLSFYCTCGKRGHIVYGENDDLQQCLTKCGNSRTIKKCKRKTTKKVAKSCCKVCGGKKFKRRAYFKFGRKKWIGFGCFSSNRLPPIATTQSPSPSAIA